MCDEGQADAVVSDVNVRMVAGGLGQLGDIVDESHRGYEVLEGMLLDEFTVLEGPAGEFAESLLNFLIRQLLHGFSFPVWSG